jgi:hypothetical protein
MNNLRIEINEPASGNHVGLAKRVQTILLPDVSSCLAMVFILPGGIKIAGHVPMFWGPDSNYEPAKNAQTVLDDMLELNKQDISAIILIGDASNWQIIAENLLSDNQLSNIDYVFIDKEKIPNAQILISKDTITINSSKTNPLVYDIDDVIQSNNHLLTCQAKS